MANSTRPEFEPALLAALPNAHGILRRWILVALGRVRSAAILSQLIAECDAITDHHEDGLEYDERLGIVEALGWYPERDAQDTLWRLFERYRHDDTLMNKLVTGLLRYPDAETIPRIVRKIGWLKPAEELFHFTAVGAIAEASLANPLADEITFALNDPDEALLTLESWLDYECELSDEFEDSFYKKARRNYRGALVDIFNEARRFCTVTNQDWSDWNSVWQGLPLTIGSFRWRMSTAYQWMRSFAEDPPRDNIIHRSVVGLCLALMGQFLIDEDDESNLAAASAPEELNSILVKILNSPRQHVLPDLVDRLAAQGPDIMPELVAALHQDDYFWPWLRALDAITRLAQIYPGSADSAVPAVLDKLQEEDSDEILEAADRALKAIGPAMVEPAAKRLKYDDEYPTNDIFILAALGEIPTMTSVKVILAYLERAGEDEFAIEMLSNLAQESAFPILKSYYQESPDPNLAEFCYTVAYLNGIQDSLMEQWKVEAFAYQETINRAIDDMSQVQASRTGDKVLPELDNPSSDLTEREREADRRVKAKEKAKRKQEKKSRKKNRKRK